MKITINGQTKEVSNTSIAGLIVAFGGQNKKLIAELNGAIVPSDDWGKTAVNEGDKIELVAFVGGG